MEHKTMMQQTAQISEAFALSAEILFALGDKTRRLLMLETIKMGGRDGVRVGALTEKTSFSRPSVSYHLKIMKDAGLLKIRKKGLMNFYYFAPEAEVLACLASALQTAAEIAKALSDGAETGG